MNHFPADKELILYFLNLIHILLTPTVSNNVNVILASSSKIMLFGALTSLPPEANICTRFYIITYLCCLLSSYL